MILFTEINKTMELCAGEFLRRVFYTEICGKEDCQYLSLFEINQEDYEER